MNQDTLSLLEKPPDFVKSVEELLGANKRSSSDFESLNQEIFMSVAERGLKDDEFALLLNLLAKESTSVVNRIKLLVNLVPNVKAPTDPMVQFLAWLFSSYSSNQTDHRFYAAVLQWLIGLIEHKMLDYKVVEVFYYELFEMLHFKELVKCACKLLCLLTKYYDVTENNVSVMTNILETNSAHEKYILAVLNVFQGFRRDLLPEGLKQVDVNKVLLSVPQRMDVMMKLVNRKLQRQIHSAELGIFEVPNEANTNNQDGLNNSNKLCKLVPFPIFQLTGLNKIMHSYPYSLLEAFKRFQRVPVPINIISVLRSNVGIFLLTNWNEEIQLRFSTKILSTLEGVLINRNIQSSEEEVEFLLNQTYKLQKFMLQGIPSVSIFLTGYLLVWDGLDYRDQILNLIEFSSFDSYSDLYVNILAPLYTLFVSSNAVMKQQILQAVTNMIQNMYVCDVERARTGVSHPYLRRAPKWTSKPLLMLQPMVKWTEQLIRLAFNLEPVNSSLLLQAVRFYELMNMLESKYLLKMWTVVSVDVVYHSQYSLSPVALGRVCRLLFKYHTEFLPQLRMNQPEFYRSCTAKINLTSKYAQELMNQIWNEQALSKKEDGVFLKTIQDSYLQTMSGLLANDIDRAFDVTRNVNFLLYLLAVREKHGPEFVSNKQQFLALLEFYDEDIANFIQLFESA